MRFLTKSLAAAGALLHAVLPTYASDVLVDTDFGATTIPISSKEPEHIQGVLPEGVNEDSAWADVRVKYEQEADRLGSDLRWIRATVDEINRGRVQLRWPLQPGVAGNYRLETTLSTPAGGRATLRVLEASPPYKVLWEQVLPLSGTRETRQFDFQLPAITAPAGLIWSVDQPGTYDLYSMRLVRRSREDVEAERAARISNAPANLAPASGFPLGLPSAWGVGRQTSFSADVDFRAAEEAGEYGTVPLVIEPKREGAGWTLYSAPFQVADPDSLHVVSFMVKGTAKGQVKVLCDGEEFGAGDFEAGPEASLVRVPFRVDPMARWIVISWTGEGQMELDALNVSMGRRALPFTLRGEAEVALAADYRKANVFVQGVESPKLKFALTGETGGATLKTRVTNLYGQSTEAEITPGELLGTFSPGDPDPGRPLGSFRAEAWLERDGEAISPVTEIVYHVVPKPLYWGRIAPESRFGNHFHPYEPHLYAAKAIGVNWNRFHGGNAGDTTYWSAVEKKKGEWNWNRDRVALYREAGFAICGVWLRAPNWARIQRAEPGMNGWLDNWWQPRSNEEFAEYVRQSIQAHSDQVDAWQIWNEPWGEFWFKEWKPELQGADRWSHGETPVEDFVKLSQVAWETAGEAGWKGPVLGIGATFGERGKTWMRKMLDLDAEKFSNTISFHAYFGGELNQGINPASETLINLENRIFKPINEKETAAAMPVWMTEGAWLWRRPDSGMHRHSVPGPHDALATVRENAAKQPLYHAIMLSKGVDKIFNYALNGGTAYYRPTPQGQINWGSMVTPSGELHPHATAYAAMALRFERAEFQQRLQIDDHAAAFVFKDENGSEFVALFGKDLADLLPRLGDDAVDFAGNPIRPDIVHHLIYASVPGGVDARSFLSAAQK